MEGRRLRILLHTEDCLGDGACCDIAPNTFELDSEQRVVVRAPPHDPEELVLMAARKCPVDVIEIADEETGEPLAP